MIRPYESGDRDAVLAVWTESVAVAHPFWAPERVERERRDIVERFLPVAETYVFEHEGTVVGFLSLLGDEVGGLFVTPRCHRQGIGRALMDRARESRGHLELDVFEANTVGLAFYTAYGFDVVEDRLENGTDRRVLRMRLPAEPRRSPELPGRRP